MKLSKVIEGMEVIQGTVGNILEDMEIKEVIITDDDGVEISVNNEYRDEKKYMKGGNDGDRRGT